MGTAINWIFSLAYLINERDKITMMYSDVSNRNCFRCVRWCHSLTQPNFEKQDTLSICTVTMHRRKLYLYSENCRYQRWLLLHQRTFHLLGKQWSISCSGQRSFQNYALLFFFLLFHCFILQFYLLSPLATCNNICLQPTGRTIKY